MAGGSTTPAASAPYAYDPDTMVVTCRACRVSAYDVLPEQAGPWHAGHRKQCSGAPGGPRPSATVLQFPGIRPAGTQGRQR